MGCQLGGPNSGLIDNLKQESLSLVLTPFCNMEITECLSFLVVVNCERKSII